MADIWDEDPSPLTEEDRAKILSRMHSLLFWLGKFVPEDEILEGKTVALRDIVFDFVTNPKPTAEQVRDAYSLANALEKKAGELEEELRKGEMTRGQAHLLLDEICGILRAVEEIRTSTGQDAKMKIEALMDRVQDEKRWLKFVHQVY